MIFGVLEEVYSLAPDGEQRELKRRSPRPLFAGDRQAAYGFAKGRAADFDTADYHADQPNPFFTGRDVVKREVHYFIIKAAMPG